MDNQCKLDVRSRAPKAHSLRQPAGTGWAGRQEGQFRMDMTHVYLWLVHIDIWQKPSQYCNYPSIKINLKKELEA